MLLFSFLNFSFNFFIFYFRSGKLKIEKKKKKRLKNNLIKLHYFLDDHKFFFNGIIFFSINQKEIEKRKKAIFFF